MKKIAFGTACGILAVFIFVVMLTLYGRSARQQEAAMALSQAIDSTLSNVMSENNYFIKENQDFTADFLKALLIQTNSDSDLTVSILDADYELGILSVEITEKFLHPNGKEGSVSDVRTVIFDRAKDVKSEMKKVCFYVGDEIYKEYGIPKDAFCTMPVSPQKDGARFRCWRFVTGGVGEAKGVSVTGKNGAREVLASQGAPYQASQDTKLIAVFDK
ncbi:MAG: hypothetical protein HFI82_05690 [Eubacterium sp.]|jgi:hypothetical protein|nr:hypothetical protein [Eubacterium sp.]